MTRKTRKFDSHIRKDIMKPAFIALAWAAALAAPIVDATQSVAMPLPAGRVERAAQAQSPLMLTGSRDGARGADGVADDGASASASRSGGADRDDSEEVIEKPSIWNLWGWWPGRRGRDGHGPGGGKGGEGGASIAGGRGGDGGRGGNAD